MKLNKTISLIIITCMFFSLTYRPNITYANSDLNINSRKIANVAVLLYSFDDIYMSKIKENLEAIQQNNYNTIHFTFFDGKNNIAIQNATFDSLLNNNYDLFIVNLADVKESIVKDFISKAKSKSVPLILSEIDSKVASKLSQDYDKVAFVSSDEKLAGMTEGRILVNLWNTNRNTIDKNGDNILQYILLQGEIDNTVTIDRTSSAISALTDSGIKTKQLAAVNANWDKELAKEAIGSLLLRYGGQIEAIISNNDAMAIGSIEALQKYGYNLGDESKSVAVVGIDATQEAKDLIDKGFMTGTVTNNPKVFADALYRIGMNLINNINPIENTNYKLIDKRIIVPVGYDEEYTSKTKTP